MSRPFDGLGDLALMARAIAASAAGNNPAERRQIAMQKFGVFVIHHFNFSLAQFANSSKHHKRLRIKVLSSER